MVGVATGLEWEPQLGHRLTHQILDDHPDLTALICLNDRLAFGAYQALQERGRQIPDDLSIVSFDDEEIAGYLRPQLTTARIPYEEMGREAMAMLLNPASDRPHPSAGGDAGAVPGIRQTSSASREASPIAG